MSCTVIHVRSSYMYYVRNKFNILWYGYTSRTGLHQQCIKTKCQTLECCPRNICECIVELRTVEAIEGLYFLKQDKMVLKIKALKICKNLQKIHTTPYLSLSIFLQKPPYTKN